MSPEAISELNQAPDAAGVGYTEICPGIVHGFTMSDTGAPSTPLLPGAPAERWEPEPEPNAWDRVFRFRAAASPNAFRLASRLAAAPLNIHVMEFVQGIHQPEGSPGDLAEVLLGGLLRKVGTADPLDETGIGYEFHDGVREVLLSAGSGSAHAVSWA
ncbi:hypothetical protein [Streptomyces sp. NEAU-YJ-81]|uniref:hypothetical protein n=1 Tax=Streptomyces sp. NEAU-YJ-81 TaxID=2820288 RepID=UPI0035B10860